MPIEYVVPILCITTFTNMADSDIIEEHLAQLVALEEDRFIAQFQQQVKKARDKSWHDQHIRQFVKHPGKFGQHWLGPYTVKKVTNGGAVQLATLCDDLIPGFVNGSRLKPYQAADYEAAPV